MFSSTDQGNCKGKRPLNWPHPSLWSRSFELKNPNRVRRNAFQKSTVGQQRPVDRPRPAPTASSASKRWWFSASLILPPFDLNATNQEILKPTIKNKKKCLSFITLLTSDKLFNTGTAGAGAASDHWRTTALAMATAQRGLFFFSIKIIKWCSLW